MTALVLASCGSDDSSSAVDDPAAITTAPTTAPPTGAATTAPAPDTTAPTPETTAPAPETTEPADLQETPACLVGSWTIDGPAWVANASAATGESMRHISGRYVYEFFDDGTYTVSVEAFTIEIISAEGTVRVESIGTEEGRWSLPALTTDELLDINRDDATGSADLPHVRVESTAVDVSEAGFVAGTRVDFGPVDQDQGIEGLGPVDCSSDSLLIRATAPIAVDVPFSRL